MNDMKCHNCHELGHRSANCVFSPTHRRCYKCGKAGGKFEHREGCEDKWYNLSIPVPRDSKGQLYPRALAVELIEAEYITEKEQVIEKRRQAPSTSSSETAIAQQAKRGRISQSKPTTIRSFVKNLQPAPVDSVESDRKIYNRPTRIANHESEAPLCKQRPSQLKGRDVNQPSTSAAVGLRDGMVQDVRVLDGLMTPDGKPIQLESPKEAVADRNKTFFQPTSSGYGTQLNEVDAHPGVDSPPLLMRLVFRREARVFVNHGTSSELELHGTVLRMANGLRVRFNGRFLDVCGVPTGDVILMVLAVNFAFRMVIHENNVEINETYFLTDYGMSCLARASNTLPAAPAAVVTILGPPHDEIRIRYRENRYLMTFVDGLARINPYIDSDK